MIPNASIIFGGRNKAKEYVQKNLKDRNASLRQERKSKFVVKLTNFSKVSFTNLVDVMQIVWVFADITHLIKLLRNDLLDYGIRLPCGTESALSDIVNCENSEVIEDIEDEPEEEKTQLAESLSGSDEEEALHYIAGYLAYCSKNENLMNKKPLLN
ncbi:hypothetical protein PR048_023510 [Dryococelus australis]|uniref:Uncharacterized protein n=1 Tax=Dryococelus australis TaxID=614101 RepID=A0ABQ9GU99_9NEOP|nr:hypothetical protein PR048_023510 [Dryococelus australis]